MSLPVTKPKLYTLSALARELDVSRGATWDWKEKGYITPHPDFADKGIPLYVLPTPEQVDEIYRKIARARRASMREKSRGLVY